MRPRTQKKHILLSGAFLISLSCGADREERVVVEDAVENDSSDALSILDPVLIQAVRVAIGRGGGGGASDCYWEAKSDFIVGRKPAFWPTGVSTEAFYDHTGTEVRYWERRVCVNDGQETISDSKFQFRLNSNEGASPGEPGMLDCAFLSTGWQRVVGPRREQLEESGRNPAKRYVAAEGCHCDTDYRPNPFGLVPGYPANSSVFGTGGHVCNDDTVIQFTAWELAEPCQTSDLTCRDGTLRRQFPFEIVRQSLVPTVEIFPGCQ